jgi:hypothetical protein
VILRPVNLRWIREAADDPKDLCAHGDIEFRIGNDVLLDPASSKNLTVSAAALYLLRTLSVPHTKAMPVGDQLFPCDGFCMYEVPGEEDVLILGGPPSGEDFEVLHAANCAGVVVRAADGREWKIEWPEWRAAVFAFADRVSDFYVTCSPKQPSDVDAAGFNKFGAEWERRRGKQFGRTSRGT